MADYSNCFEVSTQCPVEATTYGYYPNLAGNALLCSIFALCLLIQLGLGIWCKTWTWLIGLFGGLLLEFVGYIGRLMMHSNPWDTNGFRAQIICLILGPSFMAASIDLTQKHFVLIWGRKWSWIPPDWVPIIFIGIDAFAIIIQAIGGSVAAAAIQSNQNLLKTGDNLLIAGIAIQMVQLVIFGGVSFSYAFIAWRHRDEIPDEPRKYAKSNKLRFFIFNMVLAYFAMLVRCLYRMPEMAEGWGSDLQHSEPKFLIMEGSMIALASICLTVAHPGLFFPELKKQQTDRLENDPEKTSP